jgi:hypothetical protein
MGYGAVRESAALEQHEGSTRPGTRSDVTLTILAMALIAVAGAVIWMALVGNGSSKVVFDGQAARYSGPASVDAGAVVFDLVNDSDRDAAFMLSKITDDTMSLADLDAYAADAKATNIPSWVGRFRQNIIPAGESAEREITLDEGRWWVTVHTAPDDENRVISAGMLLEVRAN